MIKQIIIIILILLLLISLYSYYCLSNSMITFENNRLNYLNTRNIDLGEKEKGLGSNLHCRNQNEEYEEAYREIAKIMLESRNDKNYIDYKNFIEENQINIQDDKLIAIKNKLGTRRESIANENDTINELNKQIEREREIKQNKPVKIEDLRTNLQEISNNKDELTETYLKNNSSTETTNIIDENNRLTQLINKSNFELKESESESESEN